MRGGGDDEDLQSQRFEFRLDEFGQFLGFRHVDLVEDDDARTFRNRNRAQRQFQLVGIFGQFMFQRPVIAHRVAVGFKRRTIDDVRDDFRAFDMT